ncbi:hypothetical protein SAMN05216233_1297 [Desulfoluna spongiiphila]|uniref:Uncharacterized protein n=1 Tax=Desulfoluna spongiiphila TaxID=419481 RepID=A0A1G5JDL1_9BACT|nr:hypothetical protein SAMN05216233_1297 [Desulfoluna spongiiphila]
MGGGGRANAFRFCLRRPGGGIWKPYGECMEVVIFWVLSRHSRDV